MFRTRVFSIVAALSMLFIATISSPVFAHGRAGDRHLFLLARAAGISRQQIGAAFKADTNLKTDRTTFENAHEALIDCLVSGGNCSNQISAYGSAQRTLSQEDLNVWQGLFQKAPNDKQAAAVLSKLKQLQTRRRDIFKQIFGTQSSGGNPGR
jgi:hypothetical protein